MSLKDDIASWMEVEGYQCSRSDPFLTGRRPSIAGSYEKIEILALEGYEGREETLRAQEPALLARLAQLAPASTVTFVVAETLAGLSQQFRSEMRNLGTRLVTPVQFFDADMKDEVSAAPTIARTQRERGRAPRAPQPYQRADGKPGGSDLFHTLSRWVTSTDERLRPVVLVTAPAGYGKSVLVRALYARAYDNFTQAKREHRVARRPFALLPEYLARATGPALRALIEAFIDSDLSLRMGREAFEWRLTHGLGMWMVDGLDEVVGRDNEFFEYVLDLLTDPAATSPPRMLICVRDSLLASNERLRDFVTDAEDLIEQYRLTSWGEESVAAHATNVLGDRTAAIRFSAALRGEPTASALAEVPYYADLLVHEFREAGDIRRQRPDDGSAPGAYHLMDRAARAIVEREYDKGLLSADHVPADEILSLAEDVAVMDLEGGRVGVSVTRIRELVELIAEASPVPDNDSAVQALMQLSLFRGAADTGRVTISQDVMGEFLVGRRLVDRFGADPQRFMALLSHPQPQDSVALDVVAEDVAQQPAAAQQDLVNVGFNATNRPQVFRNIIQIMMKRPQLKRLISELPLDRKDLSNLRFHEVNFRRSDLQGSVLSGTVFDHCDLSQTSLVDTKLSRTRFIGCRGMESVAVGDLAGFHSAAIDTVELTDPQQFVDAVFPGQAATILRPCPWAQQVRFLFSKYVHPDGSARRDWLDENALRRGRRYADPEAVIDAAVSFGFISFDRSRHRYHRARENDAVLYNEMVDFVRDLDPAQNVRALLDDLCREPSCLHILRTREHDT